MRTFLPLGVAAAAAAAVLLSSAHVAHADEVVLYRCTDGAGALTITDEPCPAGQRQQVMSMLRPKDAPGAAAASPSTAPEAPVAPVAPPPTVVVVQQATRPLYECVRPDGSTYESDTADGDPRWVPLWTLGYPGGGPGHYRGHRPGRPGPPPVPRGPASGGPGAPASAGLSAPPSSTISIPPPNERPVQRPPPRPGHGHGDGLGGGYDAGTWVRDDCHALPQHEVCARLLDRRDALRTRFFNAQQRERDTLRVEERGINARLAQDCGVR